MRILRPLMLLSGLFLLACGGVVGDLSGATALQAELDQARADLQSSQERLQSTQELADARQLEVAELQARLATCACPEVAAAEAAPAEVAPPAEPAKVEPAKTTTTTSSTSTAKATTTTSTPAPTKTTSTTTTSAPAAETTTSAATTSRAPVATTGQIEIAADDTVRMTIDGKSVPYSKLKNAFIAKDLEAGAHTVVLKSREGNVDLSRVIDVVAGKRARFELKGGKLNSLGSVDATN